MPQSFKKRFAGRDPAELINELEIFGFEEFCKHEGIKGWGLQKWLQKQKGHENDSVFSYLGKHSAASDLPLAKQIMLAIQTERSKHETLVADYKNRLGEKDRLIEQQKEQLRYYRMQEYRNLQPVWDLINNKGDPVEI